MTVIHVGDVGTVFRVTIVEADGVTVVPVSTATKKCIHFQKEMECVLLKLLRFIRMVETALSSIHRRPGILTRLGYGLCRVTSRFPGAVSSLRWCSLPCATI